MLPVWRRFGAKLWEKWGGKQLRYENNTTEYIWHILAVLYFVIWRDGKYTKHKVKYPTWTCIPVYELIEKLFKLFEKKTLCVKNLSGCEVNYKFQWPNNSIL